MFVLHQIPGDRSKWIIQDWQVGGWELELWTTEQLENEAAEASRAKERRQDGGEPPRAWGPLQLW